MRVMESFELREEFRTKRNALALVVLLDSKKFTDSHKNFTK